eukprot:TRINITY_DN14443_c0_g1_i1.p1 TRINITY_DN14443_c0_g1~~TRINITY_DN14443_c0_g1_i1.p1  ORF type:complete len:208 (+),score=34.41 TRINITY_DN14443_c0_g1_i1:71-694(+)
METITSVPSGSIQSGTFGAEYRQGSFRVEPVSDSALSSQTRVATSTNEIVQINPKDDRKACIASLEPHQFLGPTFLDLYVVDSGTVPFSEASEHAINLASKLNVAQHVVLYLSQKEKEQIASEIRQNNIATFPTKISSAGGDLSKVSFNSTRMYEYIIVVRSANVGAYRGYEVVVGEDSRKFQYSVTTAPGNNQVPLFVINHIIKML